MFLVGHFNCSVFSFLFLLISFACARRIAHCSKNKWRSWQPAVYPARVLIPRMTK